MSTLPTLENFCGRPETVINASRLSMNVEVDCQKQETYCIKIAFSIFSRSKFVYDTGDVYFTLTLMLFILLESGCSACSL